MASCSGAVIVAAVVSRIAIGDMSLERYDSKFRGAGNIAQMELDIGTDLGGGAERKWHEQQRF